MLKHSEDLLERARERDRETDGEGEKNGQDPRQMESHADICEAK